MNQLKKAPTYLGNFATYDKAEYFYKMLDIEWRGQLKSSEGNTKFKIKYYGDIHDKYGLIVCTDFSMALVYAEDVETGEKILLFDGCKHGYNSMFCDEFTEEQHKERPVTNIFKDSGGQEVFEVIVSVYYNVDYDEEMEDFKNEKGEIVLISGEKISEETLKRNGFDVLGISVINTEGKRTEIVEEELA